MVSKKSRVSSSLVAKIPSECSLNC